MEEITRGIFIRDSHSVKISYISKTLIFDKKELVLLRKERSYHQNHEIIFPKIEENFEYKTNTPLKGKVCRLPRAANASKVKRSR